MDFGRHANFTVCGDVSRDIGDRREENGWDGWDGLGRTGTGAAPLKRPPSWRKNLLHFHLEADRLEFEPSSSNQS
jgi:hypothetical protein